MPQLVPSQVATPLACVGHVLHDVVPQLDVLLFETQLPPQL